MQSEIVPFIAFALIPPYFSSLSPPLVTLTGSFEVIESVGCRGPNGFGSSPFPFPPTGAFFFPRSLLC
jgi:hypothetical protein